MEMLHISQPQESKPMVLLKKTVKIIEPEKAKAQDYVPKQPPVYISPVHHKNPALSPTVTKITHYNTFKKLGNDPTPVISNSTRKSPIKPSIPEPKIPIAMRRRVTKEYMPNYMKRPSLPKVRNVI
jgi:hypothetical protein